MTAGSPSALVPLLRRTARGTAAWSVFLATAGFASFAGGQPTPSADRMAMYEAHVRLTQASPFKNLPWQFLGPTNISGRMTDVDVVAPKGKNYTIYVAGASGGVWRTRNEGVTWEPVFQHAASTSIGDIALAPSNPNILWVGTGEANIFRSSFAGAGVYKSTDGGQTWTHMGLAGTHTIPRIVIHPTNPEIVYVASSGAEWTFNEDRGLYKTTDGGRTWDKVFYVNEQTGVIDLVMHPRDPNILYVATWQRIRLKWNDPRTFSHYTGSAIHKTTDGGRTWKEITRGLPLPHHRGRIGIDISRSNPNVLYAFVDNYEVAREAPPGATDAYGRPRGPVIKGATVYRSDDGGESWRQVSEPGPFMENFSGTYGWVFGQIRVDPNLENRVYIGGIQLGVSDDGGRTFRVLRGMHVDHHGLWIDPDNSDYLVNVNDGGVAISYDAGANWRTFYDNLPLVQFFNVAYDMREPFRVYGSIQDHGSYWGVVDLSRGRHNIPAVQFQSAPGGEGSNHAIDPTDPNTVYSAGFYGSLQRTDMATGQTTSIVPRPEAGELPFRGQWLAPFILSPHNPRVIYHGMNYLFRSMHRGDSWERISPDLSFNDPQKLGDIPYQTLFSIAESPFQFGLLYVGTDDGRVWRTDDGGRNWKEIGRGVPVKWVAELVASKYDANTVYMAQNGRHDDDFKPYLWKSTDRGEHWVSIVNNLPSGPINVIKEDPKNPQVLYVGTDLGVYVSLDGGREWHALPGGNLPTSFFLDLVVHPRDDILVAASHGRGLWALDVRPLQALTAEVQAKAVHLFPPEPVRAGGGGRGTGLTAAIQYWVGSPARQALIQIKDAGGRTVREWTGPADRGFQMVLWDLAPAAGVAGGGGPGGGQARVAPGSYTVTVTVGTATSEGRLEVVR